MPSKMVTDREKVDEALVAALATHRDKVLEGLQERLGPWLPEGTDASGFAPFYDAIAGLISAHKQRLAETDRRTLAERLDDRPARRRRDEVAEELRRNLLLLRRTSSALFGPDDGVELLRLDGRLRLDPKVVHRAAVDVLGSLQSPDLELPDMEVPGVDVQAPEWVARLEPLTTELGDLLRDIAEDRQESGGMTAEKTETMDEHDREVRLATRFLLAAFRLADQSALARVVRRAIRRRARRSDVEALEEASEPEAGTEAPANDDEPGPSAGESPAEGTPATPASPAARS
jgi:hypothetical protein